MTSQAALVNVLLGQGCEADDFADISPALYVFRAGAVTRFTAVATLKRRFKVRRAFKALLVEVLMAGFADINANVLS